ncbi:hypothetical protein [Pseudoalteromonas sp. PS5]|uniref:hypothetical protein n=1 Tax=Pseudoalteromonas sp. PS5 TaxID=1437473 RepID=UPI000FFECEC9|nr:hypothetical protein [Pseudoalteromonas sp. PS5]RXF00746.1 hypothetical protein D9603_14480 [Pseudoalteromonas sp. PS5]
MFNEEKIPFDQQIGIALFFADLDIIQRGNALLYLQKHRIVSGANTIELTVKDLPKFAGIDPFVKLVDKKAADNIKSL